jgi:hypothetical protein
MRRSKEYVRDQRTSAAGGGAARDNEGELFGGGGKQGNALPGSQTAVADAPQVPPDAPVVPQTCHMTGLRGQDRCSGCTGGKKCLRRRQAVREAHPPNTVARTAAGMQEKEGLRASTAGLNVTTRPTGSIGSPAPTDPPELPGLPAPPDPPDHA